MEGTARRRGLGKGLQDPEAVATVGSEEEKVTPEINEELLKARVEWTRNLREVNEAIQQLEAELSTLQKKEGAIIAELYTNIGVGEELLYHQDLMTPPRQSFAQRGIECIRYVIETEQAVPLFIQMNEKALISLRHQKTTVEKELEEIESRLGEKEE